MSDLLRKPPVDKNLTLFIKQVTIQDQPDPLLSKFHIKVEGIIPNF
jgi:HSP90 family molecular chaperone